MEVLIRVVRSLLGYIIFMGVCILILHLLLNLKPASRVTELSTCRDQLRDTLVRDCAKEHTDLACYAWAHNARHHIARICRNNQQGE